ncbi:MAG: hypothetical protein JSR82_11110 [Verrucomicrobia bacterium]|nr:hypothetical protein [Verrucomicrobiota bacterium]
MKALTRSLLLSCLALAPAATAQIVPDAVPWVTGSATRFAATYDQNADGLPDVVLLDRARGVHVLGLTDAAGAITWGAPQSVGFEGVETLAVGQFLDPLARSLAVTSRTFNAVQFAPVGGGAVPDPLYLSSPDPLSLATLPIPGELAGVIAGFALPDGDIGGTFFAPPPLEATRTGADFGLWQAYSVGNNPRQSRIVHAHRTAPGLHAVVVDFTFPATATHLDFRQVDASAATAVARLEDIAPGSHFVHGFFNADLAALDAGGTSTTLLLWTPGDSLLHTGRLNEVAGPSSGLQAFPLSAFPLGRPIREVHVLLSSPAHRLLVVWADAPAASIFSFDGTNPPALLEDLDLGGLEPDTLLPVAASGDFYVFGGQGGAPTYARFSDAGSPGHYTRRASGALPDLSRTRDFYANLLAFRGEPFVDPTAVSLQRFRVRDWTTGGSSLSGNATVESLLDAGTAAGLGSLLSSPLSVPVATSFLLANQLRPAASVAFHSPRTQAQSARPQVRINPASGLYPAGTPLALQFDAGGAGSVMYSINGSPWRFASVDFQLPTISSDAVVRAYVTSFVDGRTVIGPIASASYTFGTVPPAQLTGFVDANGNGLSDAWEALTGVTNPNGDDDGDGMLNYAEHNAGTDPRDPLSRSPAVAAAPQLRIAYGGQAAPGTASLRWDASDPAVVLQESADLQNWTVVVGGIQPAGAENVYPLPLTSLTKRYYRLRR